MALEHTLETETWPKVVSPKEGIHRGLPPHPTRSSVPVAFPTAVGRVDEGPSVDTSDSNGTTMAPIGRTLRRVLPSFSEPSAAEPLPQAQPSPPATSPRPSKFLEGSMNDRASNVPPVHYWQHDGAEGDLEEETAGRWADGSSAPVQDRSTADRSGAQSSNRNSGLFRFGKSLAAAFNPASLWDGVSQIWRHDQHPQHDLLKERRVTAEHTYADLKREGRLGLLGRSRFSGSHDVPSVANDVTPEGPSPATHRHAGNHAHGEPQRDDDHEVEEAATEADRLMPPPPPRGRSASPMSPTGSERRTFFGLKRSSLGTLQNTASDLSLPYSRSTSNLSLTSSFTSTSTSDRPKQVLRKQLSKKDLQKHRKLSKKVSDLEIKLDHARRELLVAMTDVPPIPPVTEQVIRGRTFTPGALASLPSERLLFPDQLDRGGDVSEDRSIVRGEKSGKRVLTKRKLPANKSPEKPQAGSAGVEGRQQKSPLKKRKSDGDAPTTMGDEHGPSRKAQKTNGVGSPSAEEGTADQEEAGTSKETKAVERKRSKIPRRRSASPLPATASSLNYTKPVKNGNSTHSGHARVVSSVDPHDTSSMRTTASGSPNSMVPPVPTMPKGMQKIVRIASGEMDGDEKDEKDSSEEKQGDKGEKQTSPKKRKRNGDHGRNGRRAAKNMTANGDFEWPEDVF
ncbi:MAG: hypothetical protein M1838_002142 [Thelocarpon superellum]|nr:MAG: hypothetical protein M1838_002142 [Thelocarpon superellum]